MSRITIVFCLLLFSFLISANCQAQKNQYFLSSGKFVIGANYWASHAGPEMWSDWDAEVVEQDLKKLSDAGLKTLRVYTTWSYFQPIESMRLFKRAYEYRIDGEPLSDDMEGRAGISKTAIQHFEEFLGIAQKYDIKLIVALLTGHMSFTDFIPRALESKNVITDSEAIKWEVRYVKYFAEKFKNDPNIIAWDLGNECDRITTVSSPDDAWCWTSQITDAIKSVDPIRPVVSGTFSKSPKEDAWNIQDLAEITDIQTVHFYHLGPPADMEPLNTIRPILGPIMHNIMTEGIGNKPSFIEEMGTLGDYVGTDSPEGTKPGFLRSFLFSAWAHNCRGLLWWIAFDQGHLTRVPYDYNARGSQYGLWYPDGKPKPILGELQNFKHFLNDFKYDILPERVLDGVCILTNDKAAYDIAYSSFILAKQAGIDIDFQYANQPIKDAKIYFLPSISSVINITRHRRDELLEKVKNGAVLYISNSDGTFGPDFSDLVGFDIMSSTREPVKDIVTIMGDKKVSLELKAGKNIVIKTNTAKVLAVNQDGNPVCSINNYGNGKIIHLNYPIEKNLSSEILMEDTNYYKLYELVKSNAVLNKVIWVNSKDVNITEHIVDANTRVAIAVNYSSVKESIALNLKNGWKVSELIYGSKSKKDTYELNGNDALVLKIEKL